MAKRLEMTEDLKKQIKKAVGDEINYDNIAAYEVVAVTNAPIKKSGTIWDKAVIQSAAFTKLAAMSNGSQFIPMHTLHKQGGGFFTDPELPVGRIFASGVKEKGNKIQLHNLIYIDLSTQEGKDLAGRMDNGTIEEVSVGVSWNTLPCSECGWDFLSDKTGYALWDRTCENGHVLGMGKIHLALDNPKMYSELSVVSKGASLGAKVLPKSERLLAEMQANGNNVPHNYMCASTSLLDDEEDPMTIAELQAQIDALNAEKAALSARASAGDVALGQVSTLEASVAEVQGKLTASEAALAEANTKLAASEAALTDATTKLTAAEASVEDVQSKLMAAETELGKMKASIQPPVGAMAFKIPLNGVHNSQPAANTKLDSTDEKPVHSPKAFKQVAK